MFDNGNTFISLDALAGRFSLPKTFLKELAENKSIPSLDVNGRRRFNPVRVQDALDHLAETREQVGATNEQ